MNRPEAKAGGPAGERTRKARPNDKKSDLITMNGVAMAAIQGLSKKVDKIVAS